MWVAAKMWSEDSAPWIWEEDTDYRLSSGNYFLLIFLAAATTFVFRVYRVSRRLFVALFGVATRRDEPPSRSAMTVSSRSRHGSELSQSQTFLLTRDVGVSESVGLHDDRV